METLMRIWDKAKTFGAAVAEKIRKTVNTAFPDTGKKFLFLTVFCIGELAIPYVIAVFDIGIWTGDTSISGMIASYWIKGRTYPFGTALLLCSIVAIVVYVYLSRINNGNTGRGFDISDSNVYGSAREINEEELREVADIVPKEEAMGTILGQLDKTEKKLITMKAMSNGNQNCLTIGPPGRGKTFTQVLNFIMQCILRRESCICTDTKGELYAKTAEAARARGYLVYRYDIKDPNFSDGWAILKELRLSDVRALLTSEIIMSNSKVEGDHDPHYAAEQALLTALCLYVERSREIPPDQKTLYQAFAMLGEGPDALDAKFSMVKYDPDMRVAYENYTSFTGSPNLRANVIANLKTRLNILTSPAFQKMTSTPDIDLTLPGKTPCIYYVEMPDQHHFGKFLASLFFSFAFLNLTEFADAQLDQKLPVRVNFMIEEAYAVGKMPTITNALATVRSRGIAVTLIVQGISQLLEIYGENMTETIMQCCDTFICLGSNTKGTAELFSWLAGDATVKVKTEHHVHGELPMMKWGRTYTTGEGRQELFTGNDIRKIKRGRLLIVFSTMDPILAYTFGIDRHIEYMKGRMPLIPAIPKVRLCDTEAKAFLRAMEEQRVMDYEKWLQDGGNPLKDYNVPKPPKGPASNTPPPKVIPYPELEQMALEHGAQAEAEKQSELLHEIQQQEPIYPEDGFEPADLPDGFEWEHRDMEEDEPEDDDIEEPEEEEPQPEEACPEEMPEGQGSPVEYDGAVETSIRMPSNTRQYIPQVPMGDPGDENPLIISPERRHAKDDYGNAIKLRKPKQ